MVVMQCDYSVINMDQAVGAGDRERCYYDAVQWSLEKARVSSQALCNPSFLIHPPPPPHTPKTPTPPPTSTTASTDRGEQEAESSGAGVGAGGWERGGGGGG